MMQTGTFPKPLFSSELDTKKVEIAVVRITNAERTGAGRTTLRYSDRVSEIARSHSENMAQTGVYAHDINGLGPSDRARKAGYPCGLGENIHKVLAGLHGSDGMADKLVEEWMDSPGHRQNILDPDAESIGVGVFLQDGWVYATQNFAAC